MRWVHRAACQGQGHLFFAPDHEDAEHRETREAQAKRICWVCPVFSKCRDFGFSQDYGLWGGLSERDRASIRRRHTVSEHRSFSAHQELLFAAV